MNDLKELQEKLKEFDEQAIAALEDGIKHNEKWALDIYFRLRFQEEEPKRQFETKNYGTGGNYKQGEIKDVDGIRMIMTKTGLVPL